VVNPPAAKGGKASLPTKINIWAVRLRIEEKGEKRWREKRQEKEKARRTTIIRLHFYTSLQMSKCIFDP
jgi:hypothetical protein